LWPPESAKKFEAFGYHTLGCTLCGTTKLFPKELYGSEATSPIVIHLEDCPIIKKAKKKFKDGTPFDK
jgi:hypothetical protein